MTVIGNQQGPSAFIPQSVTAGSCEDFYIPATLGDISLSDGAAKCAVNTEARLTPHIGDDATLATLDGIRASHLDATGALAGRSVTLSFGAMQNSHSSTLPAAHGQEGRNTMTIVTKTLDAPTCAAAVHSYS